MKKIMRSKPSKKTWTQWWHDTITCGVLHWWNKTKCDGATAGVGGRIIENKRVSSDNSRSSSISSELSADADTHIPTLVATSSALKAQTLGGSRKRTSRGRNKGDRYGLPGRAKREPQGDRYSPEGGRQKKKSPAGKSRGPIKMKRVEKK
jgi:hypothetical protein